VVKAQNYYVTHTKKKLLPFGRDLLVLALLIVLGFLALVGLVGMALGRS
jgi:hypothetical protein